jgi:hypothetical protein
LRARERGGAAGFVDIAKVGHCITRNDNGHSMVAAGLSFDRLCRRGFPRSTSRLASEWSGY